MPTSLSYILVALLGSSVGFIELLARYRDSPFRAALTPAGIVYILINGFASVGALFLLEVYDVFPKALWTDYGQAEIVALLTAGFGAMVFFRSSIFNVRVGNTEWGVGPASLLQILIDAVDRACDRARATPRSKAINSIMRGVSFSLASEVLPTYCFSLMQNVRPQEQQAVGVAVSGLKSSEMSDNFKSLALGLNLLNIVGEKVLHSAVQALGGKIRGPAAAHMDTILSLKDLNFDRDHEALVLACRTLASDKGQRAALIPWLQQSGPSIHAIANEIKKNTLLDSDNKILLLATELYDQYGESVLQAGIRVIKNNTSPSQGGVRESSPIHNAAAGSNVTPLAPSSEIAAAAANISQANQSSATSSDTSAI